MKDSRLAQIRRLVTEADQIAVELRDETSAETSEGQAMDILHNYLSWAVARTTALEGK